ncbi:uncharacterized protein FPOAC1_013388 [Fusarium poae]|uniref:uncharacterized protein n=1 Tax=Fusarium poae TaxID=36050 RepID=UPI001D036774|nr:uncharacterized protein FPOAC1_013388 [Fusarium poae]KAG8664608.1 hypothetical protein FPOAC1_013388 [Fusarium poae]
MDRLSARQKPDAEALMALQPRASNLENAVCLFRSRHSEGSPSMSASPNSAPGGTPHMHMVRALASALVFFYRRIRKVNPLVLQDSVNDVVDSLHAFDEALERNNLLGPGTAWPAFIAGAEARGRQRSLSRSGWTRDFRGVDLRVINLRRSFEKVDVAKLRSKLMRQQTWKTALEARAAKNSSGRAQTRRRPNTLN